MNPVTYPQLLGIFACLALALVAHLESLPVWVLVTVVVSGGIRLLLARRGRPAPPRGVRLAAAALAILLLFLQLHTFNGLSAGTSLLVLMAGLKLLETDSRRDIYVITLIIYFVSLAALLEGESFWLLAYLIGVCWLTTATLLRLTSTLPVPGWRRCLRYSGRILCQAVPLALVFWLLFPRLAAPLWHLPEDRHAAASGLSDSMSPGDIDQLALSDDVAFRVRFAGAPPPPNERYWRGPVLSEFDGRKWSRTYSGSFGAPPLQALGPAYRYTVSLEPNEHNWIFSLDWPAHWDLQGGFLNGDYMLVQRGPVSHPLDVDATSYTRVQTSAPLSDALRKRDTRAARGRNPRSLQLAHTLRSEHPDDMDYVRAVLSMFTQQPFFYTLTPPLLHGEPVDEFLFDTRRGFCEHYASAFAMLMRAAGIPSHVVTGYQGGTFNRFADYWIVRQSDAHAWDEVWIDGRGWIRIDPTAAVAPSRIEQGLSDALSADEPLVSRWQRSSPWLADARLRLDALRQLWRERILFFDQDEQQKLLEWLHIPEPDGQKLVLVLTAALSLVLCWLTWQVRREVDPARKEPLIRAYARLCAKLAALGVPRLAHEGAEDYATRVAQRRPDLGASVGELCRHYSSLRYAAASARITVSQFDAAVRAFRPKAKPARGRVTPPDSRAS
jgi:transglutaminase-like putative cysteine protease